MTEPTYTVVQIRCNDCGEHFWLHDENLNAFTTRHAKTHAKGRCNKCGHWNEEHHDRSRFPEPVAGYHNGPLICSHAMGQGDFCGCGVEKD
jgi:hypothetical protein